jgi:2-haloacid dehalogenase
MGVRRRPPRPPPPRALLFDVFGTVVDWRGSIVAEGRSLGRAKKLRADWGALADGWRAGYPAAMDRVRRGELPWTPLDALHRQILEDVLARFGLAGALDERERQALNLAWHRLRPWPDSVAGLRRLKRRHVVATLSNGNVALLVEMAKRARLPWDAVLSAELFRRYKPDPEVYVGACGLLGLEPSDVMMVAAHEHDLEAARRCGLRTAYVRRPLEHGPPARDVPPRLEHDVDARDLVDLARRLGA